MNEREMRGQSALSIAQRDREIAICVLCFREGIKREENRERILSKAAKGNDEASA